MDPEVLDVVRPLLIMGGAITFVMLCRELHMGWLETVALKGVRQAQDRPKPRPEEKEADEE